MKITRKGLLRWTGFLGAGAALPQAVSAEILRPREPLLPRLKTEDFRPSLCKLCPSQCMLRVRVVDGKAVGVEGRPGHPLSRGSLCPKGHAVLQEQYHPDRLNGPLRRVGPKGCSGRWEKTTWEEASRLLQGKLTGILDRKSPRSLAVLGGSTHDLRREIFGSFARAFGTDRLLEWRWTQGDPPLDAFNEMYGGSDGAYSPLGKANQLFVFGWDWLQESGFPIEAQRTFSELRRGKGRRRVRIWQIDSRLSTSANKADEWISIKPGTEGVLALGIARTLIRDGREDADFLARRTEGFKAFSRYVRGRFTPELVSKITGVAPRDIRRLARAIASDRSSLMLTNRTSPYRQAAVHCLNLLIGNEGVAWGRRESLAGAFSPAVPESITDLSPKVEVLLIDRCNPAFLAAQPGRWKRALEGVAFVVNFAQFLDETSESADLVLPPHGPLESWQSASAKTMSGGRIASFSPPAVSPLHDTREPGDFILELGRALGKGVAKALPKGDFAQAARRGAEAGGVLAELEDGTWSEEDAASRGKPPRRRIKFPMKLFEGDVTGFKAPSRSLRLCVYTPLVYSYGAGAHLPYLNALAGSHLGDEGETWAEFHPETAKRLGIEDKRTVWLETSVGRIRVKVRIYRGARRDTVAVPFGMGHSAMGRFAKGVGSNPGEIVPFEKDGSGRPMWKGAEVSVYAA